MGQKRLFSRIPFTCASTITVDRKQFNASILNLSLKGALTTRPGAWLQNIRHDVMLEIKLGNSAAVMQMDAEIAHESEDTLGLRFIGIDLDSIFHLRRLLELNAGDASLIDREVSALRFSVRGKKPLR